MVDLWYGRGIRFRKRSITRTFEFLSDQTLEDLHWQICFAYDRDDTMHLYRFCFGSDKPYDRRSTNIDCPESCESEQCTNEVTFEDLHLAPKDTFFYLFDYGDDWWHRIIVLDTDIEPDPDKDYPILVASKGDSPSQYEMYDEEEDE